MSPTVSNIPRQIPILAAAAPLLMLFGQLRLIPVERQAEPLAEHVAEAIDKFDAHVEKAGVAEEDARIAKFVLCETADDLIGNLPWPRKDAWAQHSMLSQFFQVEPDGTGFFEALNKILANPEAHYDLLELMHACLSLGFEGQYRGVTRERHQSRTRPARRLRDAALLQAARRRRHLAALAGPGGDDAASRRARLPLWVDRGSRGGRC